MVLTLRTISEMCVNASSPVLVLKVFKYANASSTDIPAMIADAQNSSRFGSCY